MVDQVDREPEYGDGALDASSIPAHQAELNGLRASKYGRWEKGEVRTGVVDTPEASTLAAREHQQKKHGFDK